MNPQVRVCVLSLLLGAIVCIALCRMLMPSRVQRLLTVVTEAHTYSYDMLQRLQRAFAELKIGYWALGGTAIGAERDGRMIPWDDDIDLGLLEADVNYLLQDEAARACLLAQGLVIEPCFFGGKIFYSPSTKAQLGRGCREDLFIDLFAMEHVGDRIQHAAQCVQDSWPHDYFLTDELASLRVVPFGPAFIPLASGNTSYLERAYGNWASNEMVAPHALHSDAWWWNLFST